MPICAGRELPEFPVVTVVQVRIGLGAIIRCGDQERPLCSNREPTDYKKPPLLNALCDICANRSNRMQRDDADLFPDKARRLGVVPMQTSHQKYAAARTRAVG